MSRPQPGQPFPAFSLQSDTDELVTQSQLLGTWTVLYAYPKDDTPGCTTQACSLRDSYDRLTAAGIQVLGLSPDSPAKHRAFREKFSLPFQLLSDPDHALAEQLEVWVEKSLYGNRYMGMERTTFVIDPKGVVQAVLPKVTPKGHIDTLLKQLVKLGAAAPVGR